MRREDDADPVLGRRTPSGSCRNSRRASGSRLATGSSRTRSSGRLATARVSASWAAGRPRASPPAGAGRGRAASIASSGERLVPARVELRAEVEVVRDAQPGVGRGVLGHEADAGELRRVGRRAARRAPRSCPRSARAGRRRGAAGWSCRPRWGRRGRRRGRPGSASVQSLERPAPAVALAEPAARRGRQLTLCPPRRRTERSRGRAPRCSRRRGRPGGPWRSSRWSVLAQRARAPPATAPPRMPVTNVPTPGRAPTRPSCSSSR